jgi:hypothetical protein
VGKVLRLEAPRSWPARDKPKFYTLPVEVQAVVLHRSQQDTKELRRCQNEAAELRKQLQPQTEKESTDAT